MQEAHEADEVSSWVSWQIVTAIDDENGGLL